MATSNNELIRVEHVVKEFDGGAVKALNDCNLSINRGEVVAIIGPSISGKSTLLRCLNLLEVPTSGSVWFDGVDITDLTPDKRSRAGLFLSFQAPVEIPGVPLSSFLRATLEGREGMKMKNKEFRKRIKSLAEELDFGTEWLDRELGVGFSGGEKKKVEMLQLLLLQPKLAILDETDSGLDVDALSVVSKGMEAYRESCDGTLLIITHNTRILEHLDVDRVHVMLGGHIVAEGDADMIANIDANGFEQFMTDAQN